MDEPNHIIQMKRIEIDKKTRPGELMVWWEGQEMIFDSYEEIRDFVTGLDFYLDDIGEGRDITDVLGVGT